jgi:hypothetical protein
MTLTQDVDLLQKALMEACQAIVRQREIIRDLKAFLKAAVDIAEEDKLRFDVRLAALRIASGDPAEWDVEALAGVRRQKGETEDAYDRDMRDLFATREDMTP